MYYFYHSITLADGPLKDFIKSAEGLNPDEAGKLLQDSDIAKVHDEIAEEGQTKVNGNRNSG